jgi:hypothetical protein
VRKNVGKKQGDINLYPYITGHGGFTLIQATNSPSFSPYITGHSGTSTSVESLMAFPNSLPKK